MGGNTGSGPDAQLSRRGLWRLTRDRDGRERQVRALMTVDASGKEALRCQTVGVKRILTNKVAVWTYYKDAKRDEGIDEATTVAYVPDKGWFGSFRSMMG